jgi:uncharacterized radical SAM superfamily Fe-S cluster-containing enzyme
LISYEEISQQLNTFLTELEQASNDKIKSQYLFFVEDEKTMFRYHDDVDVKNSIELLKWQHQILDRVCKQMFKTNKNKSILNLSKEVRKKIAKHETNQQFDVLLINVNWWALYQNVYIDEL